METTQQLYKYEVGYKVPAAGREGTVGVKAENVLQAQSRAASEVSKKSPMATVIIIRNVQCKGATT